MDKLLFYSYIQKEFLILYGLGISSITMVLFPHNRFWLIALVALLVGSCAKAPESSPLVLFGAQSGKPTTKDVRHTLETAKKAGYSDFMVYPRSGLEYEYMGEEWLDLVEDYLREAKRLGMGIWLYDEFNWPSGSCHGKVTEAHPEYANTTCALYTKNDGSFDWRFFKAKGTSANVFDEDAMKLFRQLTHEVYEKRFRQYFGTVIHGIFTDEPGSEQWSAKPDPGSVVEFRWYPNLEQDYLAETGRDFRADVEAYCRDKSKGEVWEDYTAVLGNAFRRSFIDPITEWCDKLGIVSTGHLMDEANPLAAAVSNGLTLHALKGLSYPCVDEIFTRTTTEKAEWLTFATAQHAISRRGNGGAAELFALGPSDLSFDRMRQMIWLAATHKIEKYFMSLHHQTARGFIEKPHYSMFHSPIQPWFYDQAAFHDAAREAALFAGKPFLCDVAVRYRERLAGRLSKTHECEMPLVALLRELETRQFTVNLVEEDEMCDEPVVFDFDGNGIFEAGGQRFGDIYEAVAFAESHCASKWRATEHGESATDLLMRRYEDGSAVFLNLKDEDRLLVFMKDGVEIPFILPGRGVWIYRPVAEEWRLSLDHPNIRRIRFLADGTARIFLEKPRKVRFATCALPNAAAKVTLDGAPIAGTKECTFLGFGYNGDYLETKPIELGAGEHFLTCEGREDRGLFLPVLWMEGEFAVNEPDTITALPDKVGCGPLPAFALADFAGKATYSADVNIPKDAKYLILGTGHAAASARLGGRDLGTRLFYPWRFEIPAALRGKTSNLEITVTTSVRPMFGAESDDVQGALPSGKPDWVKTLAPEAEVGLVFAYWSKE